MYHLLSFYRKPLKCCTELPSVLTRKELGFFILFNPGPTMLAWLFVWKEADERTTILKKTIFSVLLLRLKTGNQLIIRQRKTMLLCKRNCIFNDTSWGFVQPVRFSMKHLIMYLLETPRYNLGNHLFPAHTASCVKKYFLS